MCNGFGGNNIWWIFILIILLCGCGNGNGACGTNLCGNNCERTCC